MADFVPALAGLVAVLVLARQRWSASQNGQSSTSSAAPAKEERPTGIRFVGFNDVPGDNEHPAPGVLAVDCESRKVERSLTHHRCPYKATSQEIRGDSSTDLVFEAVRKKHKILEGIHAVTVNHFDIDAFTSVLTTLGPRERVLRYEDVIRETARIGDFRDLDYESLKAGNVNVVRGLQLCCFLNTVERTEFARPFEDGSDPLKWSLFLNDSRVWDIIEGRGELHRSIWGQEYDRVVSDCESIRRVQRFKDVGLTVVEAPEPIHYYALFSNSPEDIVLAMYDGNRYELEQRYSTYVEICSRPVYPRICMTPLAKMLQEATGEPWHANRFIDSGPMMRIDEPKKALSKAERYGHSFERPIYASKLSPEQMQEIVHAYFKFGLKQAGAEFPVPAQQLPWAKLHELNGSINWSEFTLPLEC